MATRKITVKVTSNIYGNFRGFLTGADSVQIGASEWDAKEWASEALRANPGATLSDKSCFTMADIDAHRASIAAVRTRTPAGLQPILPQSPARVKWETKVVEALCALCKCTTGDAQAIMEGQPQWLEDCWITRTDPARTAGFINTAASAA